jgi:hypothetical protein
MSLVDQIPNLDHLHPTHTCRPTAVGAAGRSRLGCEPRVSWGGESWGRERLARELVQDVVREPGRVEHCEERLDDGQGETLVVLQGAI